MQLVWESTGDSLDIVGEDSRVIDYWIEQINLSNKNSFELVDGSIVDNDSIKMLSDNIRDINNILIKFKIEPLIDNTLDFLNQDNLNKAHEKWVKLHHKHKIISLLSKFKGNELKKFRDINNLIHEIEKPTIIKYDNDFVNVWQVKNPFGSDILKFGTWQVELHYQNLGRSTYEKWLNFDNNLVDSDTNNFTHFGGKIHFYIGKPFAYHAPEEYVKYCSTNNVTPYGNKLPIGNFTESITTLRHVFNKNVGIKNNRISFTV